MEREQTGDAGPSVAMQEKGANLVDVATLTTFEVEADGSGARLHLLEQDGSPVTVAPPSAA